MKRQAALLLTLGVMITMSSCAMRPERAEEQIREAEHITQPAVEFTPEPDAPPAPVTAAPSPTPTPPPQTYVSEPTAAPTPAPTEAPEAQPVVTAAPIIPAAPVITPEPVAASPVPATPTPEPHIHAWSPVTELIHHEAVTEEVKVVDQPATEGHFEGGTYPVMVCRCGAEFTSGDAWEAHALEMGKGHGGFTDSWRSDQVWVEGTPEASHMETVIIQDAWDEEVTVEYRCSCGAVK